LRRSARPLAGLTIPGTFDGGVSLANGTVPIDVDVSQLIDTRPLVPLQILIIVLCGLVVLFDGYDIQTMALAVPSIAAEWKLPSSTFGLALAASLFGLMGGSGLIAPLGDRFGRRLLLVGGMVLVGVASLCTAYSTTPAELVAWRFMTGLGLGASIPNGTALTSDYMPARRRAALVTLMFCNMAVGAFAAGFTAPWIASRWGWHGFFVVGGILPLVLSAALFAWLPESVRFLLARNPHDPRIGKILARIAPEARTARTPQFRSESKPIERYSILALFVPEYRVRTALVWSTYILNLFVLYVLVSWIPTLLGSAGWAAANASRGVGVLNGGGVIAGLLISGFVDRNKALPAMLGAYLGLGVALALFSALPSGAIWWLLLLIIGGGTSGAQMTLNALAASIYPPAIRATGVGWATSIGRFGAAFAPLAAAAAVGRQFAPQTVLAMLIVPVLGCAVSVSLLMAAIRNAQGAPSAVSA
jgi:AAHS family 4-hydroxybenzoate transporter-like MFS transporter